MNFPQFKVNITHDTVSTDYINRVFITIQVKRRENNYDVATLIAKNPKCRYYLTHMAKFDEIKIYFKSQSKSTWIQVFGGNIRQANPTLDSTQGELLTLNCKGYGAALEETHCNRDYGIESANPTYPRPWNIWGNVVAEFTNKSFADSNTGYALTHDYITDYFATDIKYVNNPYRANIEIIDTVCQLTSAIGAGTTAGAHWIVDNSKRFLVAKIGDHAAGGDSPETYWPDWWLGTEAASTLTQGIDFTSFGVLDKSEEYANKVVLVTDFRRPSYDYYTENHAALWSSNECTVEAVSTTPTQVVGTHCIKLSPTNPAAAGYAYFRFNPTYALDVTKIGSIKTIPRLNFYSYKPSGLDETNTSVRLYKTDYATDYFECVFNTISQDDDVWAHKSIPIGPYWKSEDVKEKNEYSWTDSSGDWASVAGIAFKVAALTYIGIDDLHITGKLVRSAYDSADITAKGMEFQKVLIARNSMDDSCIAEDDTGFSARIALAELLRRKKEPLTITFTISKMSSASMMAGQKIHVHACKQIGGTYAIDVAMRLLTVQYDCSMQSFSATVTATSDLVNSSPISVPDAYAMWQENMFVNSSEAKNIRAGAEVDLLIPQLEKDYG
jgi:hypothetical protein